MYVDTSQQFRNVIKAENEECLELEEYVLS